ncbi:biotin synthase BioB [Calothrix sp. 336/3]|uniref:biotin synthase BioB n=1 Tax=Calothrix sp. 336/3 TaxID=1337936 RepID=UPI000624A13E|nr:radical SAM protein [Calothrix sp. 336/3]AKG22934.1 biotin synthase [Calothrix sp. 336/3]
MQAFDREELIDIRRLTKSELIRLIQAEGELQEQLFRQARQARHESGADQVLLRGVIEISNFCQKNCDYCAMRVVNKNLDRYRLQPEEILAIAAEIKKTNTISTIFLQAGQDPQCDAILAEVIPEIKRQYNLNVLLCLGERPRDVYFKFAELGADSYILKFETSDPQLYQEIAHTPLLRRLQCIRWLQEAGFKVGTGNIVGLPHQTLETLADDILLALDIQPDFVSSSPFIPNQNTPLENIGYGNLNWTLNTMAIYRIALPSALIPTVSALEKIQTGGQLMGLNAGANVLTINFTPQTAREKYVIYSEQRFVVSLEHARKAINRAGLQIRTPASAEKLHYSIIP